jgi:hypothetical protein
VVAIASAAAQKAGSVHVVVKLHVPGQSATYVDDAAPSSGTQVINASGGVQVTTLVVHGTAYVKASQAGLLTFFQSPGDVAQHYANHWLSFGPTSQDFAQIAQAITLGSLLKEVTPTGSASRLSPSEMDGQSVVGIRGALPGGLSGTLFVAASGTPLPVQEVSRTSSGVTTAIFSDWGEHVNVVAPPHATPGDAIPSLNGVSATANDRAAQSNLVNALTEVLALYQNSQSFCATACASDVTPLTLATIHGNAPEFTWTNGAVTPGNNVSVQPVDVSGPSGSGQGVILAVMSQNDDTCWYAVDLESTPSPAFKDAAPNIDFSQSQTAQGPGQWEAPVGSSGQKITAGTFYAQATVGGSVPGSPTSGQGCVAEFPVGNSAGGSAMWKWGSTFSNAPIL